MNEQELSVHLERIAKILGWNVVMTYEHGELVGFAIGNQDYLRRSQGVDFAEGAQRPALQLVE